MMRNERPIGEWARGRSLALAGFVFSCLTSTLASAQNVPRDQYLDYMPLDYPRLVRETEANRDLQLYGDKNDPGYRDENPRDGIDDRRGELLKALGVRFAPLMVENTTAIPMDFRKFMDQGTSFPLYVDRWNVAKDPTELIEERTIDWTNLGTSPCPDDGRWGVSRGQSKPTVEIDDCLLVQLLREFDPDNPTDPRYNVAAQDVNYDRFTVMYFDFPGDSPQTWKEEYQQAISGKLPRHYSDFARVYLHPFIEAKLSNLGGTLGYEFVLQFWFFYPWNDGGNNHEGDWEHLNVVISPKSKVGKLLDADEIIAFYALDPQDLEGTDPIVIKRLEYYFHHNVMELDFSSPNVYLPKEEWEAEVEKETPEFVNEKWFWERIRYRAYWDDEETVINTNPIGFVGADNKGLDQLLAAPGGRNRDSHGTYPFTGLYKNVGPAGSTEQIHYRFDHRWYYRDSEKGLPKKVVSYVDPELIDMVPDWERVHDLVQELAADRQEWAWLLLPIRWGYPASESPFAGVVSHAETGNLAPPGPAFQSGWNRARASSGFTLYEPHKYNSLFPLGVQDTFSNNLGALNVVGLIGIFPPIDVLWRVVAAPFRALLGGPDPVFFPTNQVPFRFVSFQAGGVVEYLPDEMNALFLDKSVIGPISDYVDDFDSSAVITGDTVNEPAPGWLAGVSLFLGKTLTTQTTVKNVRGGLGFDAVLLNAQQFIEIRSDLNLWEVTGSFRYNLATRGFQPYLRGGYGISWYRLEGITTQLPGEDPLPQGNGPWIRQPWHDAQGNIDSWANIWPNTWHLGLGFEWVPIRSIAPPLRGTDLSVQLDVSRYSNSLGVQENLLDGVTFQGGSREIRITRYDTSLTFLLSF